MIMELGMYISKMALVTRDRNKHAQSQSIHSWFGMVARKGQSSLFFFFIQVVLSTGIAVMMLVAVVVVMMVVVV